MRLPLATAALAASLLAPLLAGCSAGTPKECLGTETVFAGQAPGLHDLLVPERPGVPARGVAAADGMAFAGTLRWDGAAVQRLGWTVAQDAAGLPDEREGVVAIEGQGRRLTLEAVFPGHWTLDGLQARLDRFLADATDLDAEGRSRLLQDVAWARPHAGADWSTSVALRAQARLPPVLAQPGDPVAAEAGQRLLLAGGYHLVVDLPVRELALRSGGLAATLQVDAEDHARLAVRSRSHAPEDAARLREATLAVAGWSGAAAWERTHAAAKLPAAECR